MGHAQESPGGDTLGQFEPDGQRAIIGGQKIRIEEGCLVHVLTDRHHGAYAFLHVLLLNRLSLVFFHLIILDNGCGEFRFRSTDYYTSCHARFLLRSVSHNHHFFQAVVVFHQLQDGVFPLAEGLFQGEITNIRDNDLQILVGLDLKFSVNICHRSLSGAILKDSSTDDGFSFLIDNDARHIAPFAMFSSPLVYRLGHAGKTGQGVISRPQ